MRAGAASAPMPRAKSARRFAKPRKSATQSEQVSSQFEGAASTSAQPISTRSTKPDASRNTSRIGTCLPPSV